MNEKLVVKSGNSFMLFEEYLEKNAESEMMNTMVSQSPSPRVELPPTSMRRNLTTAQKSPNRGGSFVGTASANKPKATGGSPRA